MFKKITFFFLILSFIFSSKVFSQIESKAFSGTIAVPVGTNIGSLPKWSANSSWIGGNKPGSNADVVIPPNSVIVLDQNVDVKSLDIRGKLIVDLSKNINLSAKWIRVMGNGAYLEWGTPQNPYNKKGSITFTGSNTSEKIPGTTVESKALMVMGGGRILMHGKGKKSWTQLAKTASPNSNTITLKEAVDWEVGDEIVISCSEAYTFDNDNILKENEKRTIKAISSDKKTITLNSSLNYHHYGKLQTFSNGKQEWTLDERAEVGLLSRNIKLQGDASSSTNKFGMHIMIMAGCKANVSGVELFRAGQQGKLARYPFHWHLAGDANGDYFKNSSIHEGYNRAVTVHGTQNVNVSDNTVYEITGHAIFLEDAAEWGNVFDGNLVMSVRRPAANVALIGSDRGQHGDRLRGPSAYWITNPNNTFTNNVAAGIHGVGFWYGLPSGATGTSTGTQMPNPQTTPIKKFDNNKVHGAFVGFHIDHANKDNASGAIIGVTNSQYRPSSWQTVTNLTVYKCFRGWWTRTGSKGIIFDRTILADCIGRGMTVSSFEGKTTNSLFVGHSDNNPKGINFENKAISLYDGYTNAYDCHFENFDQNRQAVFEWFGGAVNKTNNVFARCTFKNVKMFNPDYLIPESNKLMSVVQDADGTVTGTPFGSLCIGHRFLIDDQNFSPIPGRHAYKSSAHFATLRIDYDRSNNSKNLPLSYMEWGDGHCIHVDEYNQFKHQLAVVPNLGRKYKLRVTADIPPVLDIDMYFARPGDVLDIQVIGASSELKVNSGAMKKSNMSEVYAATSSSWAWQNGVLHLRLVASGGGSGVEGMNGKALVRVVSLSGNSVKVNNPPSRPYGGSGHKENTKIEAEWFDYGGLRVAYNRNVGGTRNFMKDNPRELTDARPGEVLRLPQIGNRRVIGDISNNNWVNYTFNITQAGTYPVKLNLASGGSGNVKVKVDGSQKISKNFGGTGGMNSFSTITLGNITLSRGTHVVTILAGSSNMNWDWMSLGDAVEIPDPEEKSNKVPTVTFTSPTTGEIFNVGESVILAATANDQDGNITKVEYFDGDNLLKELSGEPYVYNAIFSTSGVHNLRVVATDNQGASSSQSLEITIKEAQGGSLCNPELYTFHFNLGTGTPEDKVNRLAELGLNGMIFQVQSGQLNQLDQYLNASLIASGDFSIYTVYYVVDLQDGVNYTEIENIYKKLKDGKTLLQIIFRQEASKAELNTVVAEIADIAAAYQKELVIYPHDNTRILSADAALEVINDVNKPNVFLAVHLCHELRAGNGNSISQVIARVAPYIKAATISGANLAEIGNVSGWNDVIKPVGDGTYDLQPFYDGLYASGYKGPVGIHSFGIKDNFGQSVEDFIPDAISHISGLAQNACNPSDIIRDISDLSVADFSCSEVQLSWSDAGNESGYRIRRKVSGEATYSNLTDVGPNVLSYIDNTVQEGVEYIYMVRPLEAGIAVALSNTPSILVTTCEPEIHEPEISFDNVQSGQILSGEELINTYAFDLNYGNLHGDGVERITFQIFDASDLGNYLDIFFENEFPFDWTLNTSVYPNGNYQLRAGIRSLDGETKWTVMNVKINNVITSLKFDEHKNTIKVYPNPAHEKINILGIDENTSWKIVNLSGIQFLSGMGNEISLRGLSQGTYIFETLNYKSILVVQ